MGNWNCLGSQQPLKMTPKLTIRNLTVEPLVLKRIERFDDAEKARAEGGISKITEPVTSEDAAIPVAPFQTRETDLLMASPQNGLARLIFEDGDEYKYSVDVPTPSSRSQEMKKVEGDGRDLTAVYNPATGFLAIYSSSRLNSWMGSLHDSYPLSMLSIPGTHNSPTCYVALPSVRCQAVPVRTQLDNGVRFLDIRVSADPKNSDLTLVHSAFPISLTGGKYFHDLLADCYAFLDENPGEVLLMSIKKEGTGRGSEHQLGRYLKDRYAAGDASRRWFLGGHIPTLGEARGRIALVRRFAADESVKHECGGHFGIDAQSWPDNCEDGTVGGGLIRVQDFYEVGRSGNITKKISFTHAHLERAAELRHGNHEQQQHHHHHPFFINFLTASNFFNATCWPERVAKKVNPAVVEYLCARHGEDGKGARGLRVGDAGTGIVVMDWVGAHGDWDLTRCVVGMNSRLKLKKV